MTSLKKHEFSGTFKTLTGLICGGVFGFILERSKMAYPIIIRSQFLYTNNSMLKLFLSGTAASSIALAFLELSGLGKRYPKPNINTFSLHKYSGNIIGGFILGIGMLMSGSCPGTVAAQIGAGIQGGLLTMLGSFVGTLMYGLAEKFIPSISKHGDIELADKKFKVSLPIASLIYAAMCGGVVLFVEMLRPWISDYSGFFFGIPALSPHMMSPAALGIGLGLIQIPMGIIIETQLRTSSSYCTIIGETTQAVDQKEAIPYFKGYLGQFWQVALMVGIGIGSFVSALQFPTSSFDVNHAPMWMHFYGGMFSLFGARLAGGCTSGHGLSGCAQLSFSSFATTAAMFAGGMVAAHVLYPFYPKV